MFVLGAVFGVIVGILVMVSAFHKDAIEHQAAHYDTNTAAFTWNQ